MLVFGETFSPVFLNVFGWLVGSLVCLLLGLLVYWRGRLVDLQVDRLHGFHGSWLMGLPVMMIEI